MTPSAEPGTPTGFAEAAIPDRFTRSLTMAIKLVQVSVEVVSVKLTKALIKQFRVEDNIHAVKHLLKPSKSMTADNKEVTTLNPAVVGWVHGSVLETGEDYWHWIILQEGDGAYCRLRATRETCLAYAKQVYL